MLLVLEVLIGGKEGIESSRGTSKKLSVLHSAPTSFLNGLDRMRRQGRSHPPMDALIEKDTHEPLLRQVRMLLLTLSSPARRKRMDNPQKSSRPSIRARDIPSNMQTAHASQRTRERRSLPPSRKPYIEIDFPFCYKL